MDFLDWDVQCLPDCGQDFGKYRGPAQLQSGHRQRLDWGDVCFRHYTILQVDEWCLYVARTYTTAA